MPAHPAARLGGPLLVAAVLVLGGCSEGSGTAGGAGSSAEAGGQATGTSAAGAPPGGSPVSCSGTSCSLTLTGDVTTVSVLGTQVSFGGVHDGQASLTVGGRTLSCRQGESVAAGPLRLTCTTVAADRVTLTAGLGG
jgi:hypothetical protein